MVEISHTRMVELVRGVARNYFAPGMDAEDVMQEGLIAAWGGLSDWKADGGRSPENWVKFCAERGIIDAVKAATREKRKPAERPVSLQQELSGEAGADSYAEVVPDNRPGPGALVEQNEEVAAVLSSVAAASTDLELQVFQRVVSGHSYIEVAEELGIDAKAVDNAYQRVRKSLRQRPGMVERRRASESAGSREFAWPKTARPANAPDLFPANRHCAESDCSTVLTIWNPGPYCYVHEQDEHLYLDQEIGFVDYKDLMGGMEVIEEAFV